YTFRELWPRSSYTFAVNLLSGAGAVLAGLSGGVTTPAAAGGFPRLYGSSAFVNTPIPAAPALDPNSATIVASALMASVSSANLSDTSAWGIPIVSAHPKT